LNSFSLEKVVEVDPTIMDDDDIEAKQEREDTHDHDHVHSEHCGDSCGHGDHSHDHSHEHEHEHTDHCAEDCSHATPDPEPAGAPVRKKKRHNLSLVSSVGYTVDGLLDIPRFNQFMSEFVQKNAINLYRTKGVLAFSGQGNTKYVFQGVHDQITFGPTEDPWLDGEPKISKLVFIGRTLQVEDIRDHILSCTENPAQATIKMHKRS
jgi:G3E family GTPase